MVPESLRIKIGMNQANKIMFFYQYKMKGFLKCHHQNDKFKSLKNTKHEKFAMIDEKIWLQVGYIRSTTQV